MAIDPNFLEMEWQNGFEATLDDRVVLTDEYIPMTPVPEGDFGRLVLEDTSRENFEIIRYNRKDAGGVFVETADGGLRNEDGSSSGVHPRGARVRGNITAQDIREWRDVAVALQDEFQTFIATLPDWRPILNVVNSVTHLGNRSYEIDVAGDLTGLISPGMRLRTTRTVAAPTKSTSLNGSSQYWVKTSPSKLTFTDDFVLSAWVKLNQYGTSMTVVSRYNGTSGWELRVENDGRVLGLGYNGSASNVSYVASTQSIPLNRWVHIAVQVDLSAFSVSQTTSYVMIDGVDVPATVTRTGTNPTSIAQAGNLEIGSRNNGTQLFPGKIAQVAIFNTKVTQATIRSYMSQGLSGTEASLASAYSFDGNANDLNTTSPNNLTPVAAAVATNADSPFGTQAAGLINSTLDYAIVQKINYATTTILIVQVPEGCTIPTFGGISAISYSLVKAPYGMPIDPDKWSLLALYISVPSGVTVIQGTWTYMDGVRLLLPKGNWSIGYKAMIVWGGSSTTYAITSAALSLSTTIPTHHQLLSGASGGTVAVTQWRDSYAAEQNLINDVHQLFNFLVRGKRAGNIGLINEDDTPSLLYAVNGYL